MDALSALVLAIGTLLVLDLAAPFLAGDDSDLRPTTRRPAQPRRKAVRDPLV